MKHHLVPLVCFLQLIQGVPSICYAQSGALEIKDLIAYPNHSCACKAGQDLKLNKWKF